MTRPTPDITEGMRLIIANVPAVAEGLGVPLARLLPIVAAASEAVRAYCEKRAEAQ